MNAPQRPFRPALLAVLVLVVALAAVGALLIAATNAARQATDSPPAANLAVFAASSLTDAFNEIGKAFEAANPGVKVTFSYGSSAQLATQINEGAPADVFASANLRQYEVVAQAGNMEGKGETFARNRLIIITNKANPPGVSALKDLAKPGLKLVLAAPNVPVRDYTNAMLDKLAADPQYGADYKAAVLRNVVSEEANVRQVAAKVALGEADAGIVYSSDVTPDLSAKVDHVEVPDALNTLAEYPIGVVKASKNRELARRFVAYVLSEAGQATLKRWNFIPIR